jgi:hypothetical protein
MNTHSDNHANAVGVGICHALEASADAAPGSPEEWVQFCLKAADEAYAEAMENPPDRKRGPVAQLLHDIGEDRLRVDEEIEYQNRLKKTPEAKDAARDAAQTAFRMCMPRITGRRATQAYIACVAAGVQRGYLTGKDASSLLYTAQLALSAWPSRRAQRGQKG